VAILDAGQRLFVLEIAPGAADGFKKILKTTRFENNSFKIIGEHFAGIRTSAYTAPWFTYQKKIFTYNDTTAKLEVFDENFKPTNHPLAEVFDRNQEGFRCMREIAIHPTLPFALIIEQGKWPTKNVLQVADSLPIEEKRKTRKVIFDEARRLSLYLFRWNEPDQKKQFIPLISIAGSIWNSYNPYKYSHLSFSPMVNAVFRDGTMRGKNVDSESNRYLSLSRSMRKIPCYLENRLSSALQWREGAHEPKSTAWTTKPTAFVMCTAGHLSLEFDGTGSLEYRK
jgi:hypothetical protein